LIEPLTEPNFHINDGHFSPQCTGGKNIDEPPAVVPLFKSFSRRAELDMKVLKWPTALERKIVAELQ